MRIKRFKEVNGNEILQPIGVMVGRETPSNYPYDKATFIESEDGDFVNIDDFKSLYNDYLMLGGKPINNIEFNKENIDIIKKFISDRNI